ncbi:hypothetical protein CVS40_4019 [Lucilia cuprina]|nr:hypothetical protein CVS40_4019 [Lucilia cuprina]
MCVGVCLPDDSHTRAGYETVYKRTIYRRLLEAQKNRTHVDPEVTLQFLKSAVYYFLTDKENSQGHLQAIESILEFSEAEKQTINKARFSK